MHLEFTNTEAFLKEKKDGRLIAKTSLEKFLGACYSYLRPAFARPSINTDGAIAQDLLPAAVRWISPYGDKVIFERPPGKTPVLYRPGSADRDLDAPEPIAYDIALPWQVYVIDLLSCNVLGLYGRPGPLVSLKDILYRLPLPNTWPGDVCLSENASAELDEMANLPLAGLGERLNAILQVFWSEIFNDDLCDDLVMDKGPLGQLLRQRNEAKGQPVYARPGQVLLEYLESLSPAQACEIDMAEVKRLQFDNIDRPVTLEQVIHKYNGIGDLSDRGAQDALLYQIFVRAKGLEAKWDLANQLIQWNNAVKAIATRERQRIQRRPCGTCSHRWGAHTKGNQGPCQEENCECERFEIVSNPFLDGIEILRRVDDPSYAARLYMQRRAQIKKRHRTLRGEGQSVIELDDPRYGTFGASGHTVMGSITITTAAYTDWSPGEITAWGIEATMKPWESAVEEVEFDWELDRQDLEKDDEDGG